MPPRRKISSAADVHDDGRQHQAKRGSGVVDEPEQKMELRQQDTMTGSCQRSKGRVITVPAGGQASPMPNWTMQVLSLETANLSGQRVAGLDSLATGLDSKVKTASLEPNIGHRLTVRTSTRVRNKVCYNEDSPCYPTNNKALPNLKPKDKTSAKRKASSTTLLSADAKRVKEEPACSVLDNPALASKAIAETVECASVMTSHKKRGRKGKDHSLKPIQGHADEALTTVSSSDNLLLQKIACLRTTPHKDTSPRSATNLGAVRVNMSTTAASQEDINMPSNVDAEPIIKSKLCKQQKRRPGKKVIQGPHQQEPMEELHCQGLMLMNVDEGNTKYLADSKLADEKSSQAPSPKFKTNCDQIKPNASRNTLPNAAQDKEASADHVFGNQSRETNSSAQFVDTDGKISSRTRKKSRNIITQTVVSPTLQACREACTFAKTVINHEHSSHCSSVKIDGVQESTLVGESLQCQKRKQRKISTRKGKCFEIRMEMEHIPALENAHAYDLNPDLEPSVKGDGVRESLNGEKILQCQVRRGGKTVSQKRVPPARGGADVVENKPVEVCMEDFNGAEDQKKLNVQGHPKQKKTSSRKRTERRASSSPEEIRESPVSKVASTVRISSFAKVDEDVKKRCVKGHPKQQKALSRKKTLQISSQEEILESTVSKITSAVRLSSFANATATNDTALAAEMDTMRKPDQGIGQQDTKSGGSESLCLDTKHTVPSENALQTALQEAEYAHNQNVIEAAQGFDTQAWTATDLTNLEKRLDRTSEKKRKEEFKRRRAMKFDALPVGFGLGISCWSPSPLSPLQCEALKLQEVIDVQDIIDNETQAIHSLGGPRKQACLQKIATLKDTVNSGSEENDMNVQSKNHNVISMFPGMGLQESNVLQNDADVSDIGHTPETTARVAHGKAKNKSQRNRTTEAVFAQATSQSVATSLAEKWAAKREAGIDDGFVPIKSGEQTATQAKRTAVRASKSIKPKKAAASRSKRTARSAKE